MPDGIENTSGKGLLGPGGGSLSDYLEQQTSFREHRRIHASKNAAKVLGRARKATRQVRLVRFVGANNTIDNFAKIVAAGTRRRPDIRSAEFKSLYERSKRVIGKTFTRTDVADIARAGLSGGLGKTLGTQKAASGLSAVLAGGSGRGGILGTGIFGGKLGGLAGRLGTGTIVAQILGAIVGPLIKQRASTQKLNRLFSRPELLEETVLNRMHRNRLNEIRQMRNLNRLGRTDPNALDELAARVSGAPVPQLSSGQVRIGRLAIQDKDELLRQLAQRSDLFRDG